LTNFGHVVLDVFQDVNVKNGVVAFGGREILKNSLKDLAILRQYTILDSLADLAC
jgi:hypothetical protein